jgi:hypothetical protein
MNDTITDFTPSQWLITDDGSVLRFIHSGDVGHVAYVLETTLPLSSR